MNTSETSAASFQQSETPTQGVKRKRRKSGDEVARRKKQKSSPSRTLELSDLSTAAVQDGKDGQENSKPNVVIEIPSRPRYRSLPPISKKKKNKIRAQNIRPAREIEAPDNDSVRREPESAMESEAEDLPSREDSGLDGHNRTAPQSGNARGAFTEKEKAKLNLFKRRFCKDYSVSEFDFNKLMTRLGRRDRSEWPNPDVTRGELRGMFYDVLLDRNRKSINRYRERYFQNVEQDTEWTEEQLNELRDLVSEKGHKWVEIAEMLGRTQDSVYQKWKNRVRQGDAQRFERWEEDERAALVLAVRDCKTAAGVPQDFSSDDKVNWTVVSDRLGKRRNAQQCSTYWQRVYRPREQAKARGEDVKTLPPARNKPEPTKARRQFLRRVSRGGESVETIKPRRKVKSDMYVTASDDEDITPVQNTQSKRRPTVKTRSTTSDGFKHSNKDVNGTQSIEAEEQEQSDDDEDDDHHDIRPDRDTKVLESVEADEQEEADDIEDEDRDANESEADTPTKKAQRNRFIDAKSSLLASSRQLLDLQPAPAAQSNGSFQAVNSQHRESDRSSKHNHENSPLKSDLPAPRSSQMHGTPRLPPLSKRTPRRITSLSQAFNNTQAPTSVRPAALTTPTKHLLVDRPSPDIEIRSRPLREESPALEPVDDNEDDTEQEGTAAASGSEFAIYESEAEDSDDGQPPQMLGSAAPVQDDNMSAETDSQAESDSEDDYSNDVQPSQVFGFRAVQNAAEVDGAESGIESESEAIQDGTDSELEDQSEEEEPLQMFSSAVPKRPHDPDAAESGSEESDDKEPPQMFSSAAIPEAMNVPPETESDSEAEEDDDEPPQMFTSALPNPNTAPTSLAHPQSPSSDTTSSSGDAPTIPPNASSDDNNSDHSSSSEEEASSGSDSDQFMVDATQTDFFTNLEASAEKVRLQREQLQQRANTGRKVGGDGGERGRRGRRKKGRKEVFDVDSSGKEEDLGG